MFCLKIQIAMTFDQMFIELVHVDNVTSLNFQ